MTITLLDMVARLEQVVPANNGVPADYEKLATDAVWQLSQDAPLMKRGSIVIVAGTAAYDLPADFLRMVDFPELSTRTVGDVMLTGNGIVPLSVDFEEEYSIGDGQITFDPTPTYSMTRKFRYAAFYALSDGSYTALDENMARIALMYAQYLAVTEQASKLISGAWKYTIGDEQVDKSRLGDQFTAQTKALLEQYQHALASLSKGAFGVTAAYKLSEMPIWA